MEKIKTTVNNDASLSEFETSDMGKAVELKGSFIATTIKLDFRSLLNSDRVYSPNIKLIQAACDTARKMHNSSGTKEIHRIVDVYYDRWINVNNKITLNRVYEQVLPIITSAKLSVTSKQPGKVVYLAKIDWNVLRDTMPIIVANYKEEVR